MRRRIWRILTVLFYLVVLLLVVLHQDMLAMYGMAVGMLLESLITLLAKSQ